jgi:hypothetical protein
VVDATMTLAGFVFVDVDGQLRTLEVRHAERQFVPCLMPATRDGMAPDSWSCGARTSVGWRLKPTAGTRGSLEPRRVAGRRGALRGDSRPSCGSTRFAVQRPPSYRHRRSGSVGTLGGYPSV